MSLMDAFSKYLRCTNWPRFLDALGTGKIPLANAGDPR